MDGLENLPEDRAQPMRSVSNGIATARIHTWEVEAPDMIFTFGAIHRPQHLSIQKIGSARSPYGKAQATSRMRNLAG